MAEDWRSAAAAHPQACHFEASAFYPDEEIGRGARSVQPQRTSGRCLHTAGTLGELGTRTSAAAAKVVFHGRNIHPGSCKNQMVKLPAHRHGFHSLLPVRPEA